MRDRLREVLVERAKFADYIFLTGDLGFMALEPVQEAIGERFINAGIAEQNMISVAAGLAKENLEVWVYSIAPFIYARGFEQIRNDICFPAAPVNLIGNGGGYAYGVMGPTHHSIEDYGVLSSFENLDIFIPAFDADIKSVVTEAGNSKKPTYIRVGKSELNDERSVPVFAKWRKLISGEGPTLVASGPLIGSYIEKINSLSLNVRPNVWLISQLPLLTKDIPDDFLNDLSNSDTLLICEEHVANGGIGMQIIYQLSLINRVPKNINHLNSKAHVFSRYGSQNYLRRKSGLDSDYLLEILTKTSH